MRMDDIYDVLRGMIHNNYIAQLKGFMDVYATPNWVIASDYVIGVSGRYKDTFCYTLYPIGDEVESVLKDIKIKIPNDLKHTSRVGKDIIECLRSDSRFSFCFIIDRGQKFFANVDDVRTCLDMAIDMFGFKDTWAKMTAVLKERRQAASARNFNFKLFSDIMLASLFCSIIAMLIAKLNTPRTIYWFSDRDNIVTSNNHVADALFAMHFYQACASYGMKCDHLQVGVGDMTSQPWYDELIRIPDFFAGALSAFDYETRNVSTQKHCDVLTKVIADAPNIAPIKTVVNPKAFRCERIMIAARAN
jgi:hypothetical protein